MDPTTIDVEKVTAVLLIDGWHYIQPRSFHIEPYAFTSGDDVVAKPQPGYFFAKIDQISREMQYFLGPIDCVMAVRFAVATAVDRDDDDEDGGDRDHDRDDDEEEF
jgi:hypothetical protein